MQHRDDRAINAGEMARLRQGLYRFFAAALLYPDAQRLANLAGAAQVFDGLEAFAFYGAWQRLLRTLQDLQEGDVAAIKEAHVRLFSVSTDGALCPPHESFYLAPPGQATGMIIAELEREYARLGIALSSAMLNIPDHAAVAMEVMAFLCDREAQAWERQACGEAAQALEEQRAFLCQHLGRWFSLFAGGVTAVAPGSFYSLVGEAADAFIHHDRDFLNLLIAALQEESMGA